MAPCFVHWRRAGCLRTLDSGGERDACRLRPRRRTPPRLTAESYRHRTHHLPITVQLIMNYSMFLTKSIALK